MNNATMPAVNGENVCENANINRNFAVMAPKSLVPVEEQALDDIKDSLSIYNPYAGLLPAEDLEIEMEDKTGNFAEAEKLGIFSPLIGMAKLPNTELTFYAKICVDEKKRKRVEFCQQYETGEISPMITVKQSDLFRVVQSKFGEVIIKDKRLRKSIENFLFNLNTECLDKFDGRMDLDIVQILRSLASCYSELPVTYDVTEEESPSELYGRIMKAIIDASPGGDDTVWLYGHQLYYPLESEDIDWLAEKLKLPRMQLLRKMKEYHFLYLPPSSTGYQANVRLSLVVDGGEIEKGIEHRYCLKRAKYFTDKLAEKTDK